MTELELEALVERIEACVEKVLSRRLPAAACVAGTGTDERAAYPEKLSRTQAARFVGGKPYKPSAQASGTDQTLLRDLRVRPLLTRHHFQGRETRARDYFSKTALAAALAARISG